MRYKYIILGAGCAGLSLCWYLLEAGVRDPILILDRKTEFVDDRTWCFWDTEPTPFTHLATNRWNGWTVCDSKDGKPISASSPSTPYVRLRAQDFYSAVLARIQSTDTVTLQLGARITDGYKELETGEVCVATSAGDFYGDTLFDALALGSPRFPVARSGDITFLQKFFGQFIRAEDDVFDPETVTLMDFTIMPSLCEESADAEHVAETNPMIRFMYLLPFSSREALVESTVLVPAGSGAKDALAQAADTIANREEIAAYLSERYGTKVFTVQSEEQGLIPMTTRHFPLRTGNRIFSIGLAGGAARPSSGYAFLRTQRLCRRLAEAIAKEDKAALQPSSLRVSSHRTAFLDGIFLQAMQDNPLAVPDYFRRLFANVPAERLVRLLSDNASLIDCLFVIAVLPPVDFIRAAVSRFWCRAKSFASLSGLPGIGAVGTKRILR